MKKWLITVALLVQTLTASALEISVGEGKVEHKTIAVVPFAGNDGGDKIDFIVSADLRQSGVFSPIDPQNYSMRPTRGANINFAQFEKIDATYVVVGRINGDSIKFDVADSLMQEVLASFSVDIGDTTLRQSAHKVSDLILKELTGKRGAFASRIAYIHERGQGDSRRYFLMLADSDGANPAQLLASPEPIMSPRFSPDGRSLAYVSFENQRAQIIVHDIYSGSRSVVSMEPGMNASPAWSPDGSRLALVLSKDGNAEIYVKNLSGGLKRITKNPSIDTEPVWSPDGRQIYFTSNRGGSPQLYKVSANGGRASKVTSAGGYSAGADISKDGNYIALARRQGGSFIVGTIDRSTNQFTGVSQGFVDETPRFSPNGQMLIFTSVENGRNVLRVVNVDGSGTNTLSAAGNIRDADWSPYLK